MSKRIHCLLMFACSAFAGLPLPEFQWATPLPHRQSWIDMASGSGVIVGITDGYGGRSIYVSTNGLSWKAAPVPTRQYLRRIKFGNGMFVAVGDSMTILTSTDGENWTWRSGTYNTPSLRDVAIGAGVVVVPLYNGTNLISTDLTNWTSVSVGTAPTQSIDYGNGQFVEWGGGQLWTSTNGFSWAAATPPETNSPEVGVVYSGGKFMLKVSTGFAVSSNLVDWQIVNNTTQVGTVRPVADGFLGLGSTVMEFNGQVWLPILQPTNEFSGLRAAASINNRTVIGGAAGLLYTSTDAIHWEVTNDQPVNYSHLNIAFGNGAFMRFANDQTLAPGVELSTDDGSNWELIADAPALISAVYGNSVWVGIGTNRTINISTNARAWKEVDAPLPATEVHFANGRFLAETTVGAVEFSDDGLTWKRADIGGDGAIKIIGNVNGRWAAYAGLWHPAISDDGEHWTLLDSIPWFQGAVAAAGNGRFVLAGGGGMGPGTVCTSSDGVHWDIQRNSSCTTHIETSLNFGDGVFLLTSSYGETFASLDGVHWVGERQVEQWLRGSAYGNGKWLVVGGDSVLRADQPLFGSSVAQLEIHPTASSLKLIGTAGGSFDLEKTGDLKTAWSFLRTVQIPSAGWLEIPLDPAPQGSATVLFRAKSR